MQSRVYIAYVGESIFVLYHYKTYPWGYPLVIHCIRILSVHICTTNTIVDVYAYSNSIHTNYRHMHRSMYNIPTIGLVVGVEIPSCVYSKHNIRMLVYSNTSNTYCTLYYSNSRHIPQILHAYSNTYIYIRNIQGVYSMHTHTIKLLTCM